MNEITSTVGNYLQSQHRQLDALLGEVEWFAERRDFIQSRQRFDKWRAMLKHHTDVEERIVFPKYTSLDPSGAAAVQRLEADHRELDEGIGRLSRALIAGDPHLVNSAISSLEKLYKSHNEAEERRIYPAIDQAIKSEADRTQVFTAIEAVR